MTPDVDRCDVCGIWTRDPHYPHDPHDLQGVDMKRQQAEALPMKEWYSVRAGTCWVLVEAHSASEARLDVLERLGFKNKPWLAENMNVHVATDEDRRRYAHIADARRTERGPKRQPRGAKDRLL